MILDAHVKLATCHDLVEVPGIQASKDAED